MLEGRAEELDANRRRTADSLSVLVSALTGTRVSAAQLLGEATAEEEDARAQARMIREGERKAKAMIRKIKKLNRKR